MTTYQYSGSGSIFESSTVDKKRSFNYNLASISQNNIEDYQSVSNSFTSFENYGEVNESTGSVSDYNLITQLVVNTIIPFGGFTFSGESQTLYRNVNIYGPVESIASVTYSPDNLGGTLFGFGEKVERRTYNYNESASENTEEDYGDIVSFTSNSDDYQSISSESSLTLDNGLITESTGGTITPFGGFTFSGSAIVQPNYRLYFYGSSIDKVIYSPEGTGTLFGFGEKLESVTYDYNQESLYENNDDYGLINEITSGGEDFGLIVESSGSQPEENYGLITESIVTSTTTPFGSLSFSGSSAVSYERGPWSGRGGFEISGSYTDLKFISQVGESTQLFVISGFSSDREIQVYGLDYVTSGTLFGFGEKIESRTYAYNDFIDPVDSDDYGFVTEIYSESEDADLLINPVDSVDNYGYLGVSGGTGAFGSIVLSGSSIEKFDRGTYAGSGFLTLSGNVVEEFSSQVDESIQLFQFSGGSIYSEINNYIASGTLFGFGEKVERRTYNYNESSIVFYDTIDYEFISVSVDEANEDFGVIIDGTPDANIDYGFLVGFGATETLYPYGSIYISGSVSDIKETDSYEGSGFITISGELVYPNIDYTPSPDGSGLITVSGTALESESDSYIGLGTIFVSDLGLESESESYIGLGTLILSGSFIERNTESYVGLGTLTLSGSLIEKNTESYVGLGTLTLSGSLIEKNTESYVGIGTLVLSGTALEAYSAQTPENTQLFNITGVATEKVVYQTPEDTQLFVISGFSSDREIQVYGLDYVTSGALTLSGSLVEKNTESYVGLGTASFSGVVDDSKQRTTKGSGSIFINGLGVESRTIFIPTSGIGTGFIGGNITISSGIALTNYYSPIYPRNSDVPGSGIGTIRINDDNNRTITRAVLPYNAVGTIFVSSNGIESFTKSNYNGNGLISISGISSTRTISVYQDYVTGGIITISQQTRPIVEKNTESYVGSGSLQISGASSNIVKNSYSVTGRIQLSGTALESYSAQTPEDTQLFTISGTSSESYSAQTPETEVLYNFSGNLTESRTYGYSGSGEITLTSSATTFYLPSVSGTGIIRFTTHLSDNLYDTCDSVDTTCDYLNSAFIKFVANPPENSVLYSFYGSATTQEIQTYQYSGLGYIGIYGSHQFRKTNSFVGIGTFNLQSTTVEKEVDSYIGSGSISVISGSSESKTSIVPQFTTLFNVSGISSTKVIKVKEYIGFGTLYLDGSAEIQKLSRPSFNGTGSLYLSGELVYPNIQYIPAPKGSGTINIIGSGIEKIKYDYDTIAQTLFVFSGGFESFSQSTYSGIGTIYIESTSSITINNPYQEPRVYVTII